MDSAIVFYTANFSGYSNLISPPPELLSRYQFLCFTDDISKVPFGWKAIHINANGASPVYLQKLLKFFPISSAVSFSVCLVGL